MLEDRLAPAGVLCYWTGGGTDNNYSTNANWSAPYGKPQNDDIPVHDGVNGPAPGKPAMVDVGFTATIRELRITTGYSNTITLLTPLTISDKVSLASSQSTININNNPLTARSFELTGGQLVGAGTVSINGTAGNPGSFKVSTFGGLVGVSILNLNANAGFDIQTNVSFLGMSVSVAGASTWSGGDILLGSAATFTNTGTFKTTCDMEIKRADPHPGAGTGLFSNQGSFIKETATLNTIVHTRFNNSGPNGSVHVKTGWVTLTGIGSHSAPFTVDANAYLQFSTSTHTVPGGATLNGAGVVAVTNGALFTLGMGLEMTVASRLVLTGNAHLNGGTFTSQNAFIWESGKITGTFNANGAVTISTAAGKELVGTFNNYTSLSYEGGGMTLTAAMFMGSLFKNYGDFEIQTGDTIRSVGFPASAFENMATELWHGVVRKTAGPLFTFNINFTTEGNLYLNGFNMSFQQVFTQSGTSSFTSLNGGNLFTDTYTLQRGTLLGNGTITGNLNNTGGIVSVGADTNRLVLTVTGNYTQGLTGVLRVYASSATAFGKLTVTGSAALAGILEIVPFLGYTPAVNDEAEVLSATGGLNNTTFNTIPNAQEWETTYPNNNSVKLKKK